MTKKFVFVRDETFGLARTEHRDPKQIEKEDRSKLKKLEKQLVARAEKARAAGTAAPKPSKNLEKLRQKVAGYDKAKKGGGSAKKGRSRKVETVEDAEAGMARWDAQAIIDEAQRNEDNPNALRHLKDRGIIEPVLLDGVKPSEVLEKLKADHAQAVEGHGHRLRKNAQVLMSRVVSFPVPLDELCPNREERIKLGAFCATRWNYKRDMAAAVPHAWKEAKSWLWDSITFSHKDLADADGQSRIRSIVLHLDESRLHAHLLAPAELDPDNRMSLDAFFKPERARRKLIADAKAAGEKEPGQTAKEAAYNGALTDMLDRYQAEVGSRYLMERKSENPRDRRRYKDHLALQEGYKRAEELAAGSNVLAREAQRERASRVEADDEKKKLAEELERTQRALAAERQAREEAEAGRVKAEAEASHWKKLYLRAQETIASLRAGIKHAAQYVVALLGAGTERAKTEPAVRDAIRTVKQDPPSVFREEIGVGLHQRAAARIAIDEELRDERSRGLVAKTAEAAKLHEGIQRQKPDHERTEDRGIWGIVNLPGRQRQKQKERE